MIDPKKIADAKRKEIFEEDAHYNRIANVFGSPDGIKVAEWILNELCGYWDKTIEPQALDRYLVGRTLFNVISFADIEIAHKILHNRREAAKIAMKEEEKHIEQQDKG